jgi:hypothetical protein
LKKRVIFISAILSLISTGQSNADAATTTISTRIAIVDTGNNGGASDLKPWGINAPNACSGLTFSQACLVGKR